MSVHLIYDIFNFTNVHTMAFCTYLLQNVTLRMWYNLHVHVQRRSCVTRLLQNVSLRMWYCITSLIYIYSYRVMLRICYKMSSHCGCDTISITNVHVQWWSRVTCLLRNVTLKIWYNTILITNLHTSDSCVTNLLQNVVILRIWYAISFLLWF